MNGGINMYEQFEKYLNYYQYDDSYRSNAWYDEGYDDAVEIIDNFKDEDWEKLMANLPSKSIIWKKRLACCMHDANNPNHLKVLLNLTNTDSEDLLKIVIGCLNSFDINENEQTKQVVNKVEQFLPAKSEVSQAIFSRFIERNGKGK